MRSHRDFSIRQKLTVIVLVTCGAAIFVACLMLAAYDVMAFRRQIAVDLSSTAGMIGSNSTAALSFGDAHAARDTLSSLAAQTHIVSAAVYGTDGSLFAEYTRPGADSQLIPRRAGPDGIVFSRHDVVVRLPIRLNGDRVGTIYVRSDLGQLYARAKDFLEIVNVVFLICLVTAYFLANRLQRLISGPIVSLARTAARVSTQNDYSLRAQKSGSDEIGSLVDRFNDMLAQIQQRDTALQAAHDQLELRVDERTKELLTQVAEREQAEKWLAERTSFLNSLIENTPVGIAALNEHHHVQMCNPAFEHLFLYKREDVLGKPLFELLSSPEVQGEVEANIANLWGGVSTHLVTRRRRGDGTMVDVEAFSVPLMNNAKVIGGLVLYQDITERKRAEGALLRAKEAAEAASRAKSEFLANMSHEIRTPMNGIIGMTELALDTELTPEQRDYLGMVKTSAAALLTVVNDILDFSKIEAGKLDLDWTDFPLQRTVGETLKALAFRAHQKNIELLWRMAPDVPNYVKGDMGRLRQILVNLVGNSVKFTEHGEIVVSATKESQDETGVMLHFQVRDTGIGIPRDKQKIIFDAFTQADTSSTRKYGGTGLGLAITSRLVTLMGGKVWVESELGSGSTFHFICHFGFAESVPHQIEAADPEAIRDLPVLVVDDNHTNRLILAEMLSAWGMKPECVDGGPSALAALQRALEENRPFRLVVCDMQMPEMNGCSLSSRILGNPSFSALPIIILSSSAQTEEVRRCREMGIAAYLMKPAQPSDLLDAILAAFSTLPQAEPAPVAIGNKAVVEAKPASLKILLAEDNPVNQKLAIALLNKRGHSVTATGNGQEAIAALETEPPFDVVLMDVQMPVMDGFEAIRSIRAKERVTGAHIPIVALTAHAMKGDREKCLAVGADDYVSKPIRISDLLEAVDRAMALRVDVSPNAASSPEAPMSVSTNDSATPVFDIRDALRRVEGDQELLEEIVRIFTAECANNMEAIRNAFTAGDARLLERLAHTIKGASANLSAVALSQASFKLEKLAASGDLLGAPELVEKIQYEIDRLLPELASVCQKVAH
ncbi:MAG TPA: response regulator [Candidatus Baltobacteraceae bacterium]|nr:response regulator [Candidatus Baltobacteraceae bacterium]